MVNLTQLKAELQADPAGRGYMAHVPTLPAHWPICSMRNQPRWLNRA